MRNKIAIICFTDHSREPRVIRTINSLKNNFDIDIYSTGSGPNMFNISTLNYDYVKGNANNYVYRKLNSLYAIVTNSRFPSQKFFKKQYWSTGRRQLLSTLKTKNYSVIIGHGIYTIPLLAEIPKSTKTIFNAHEYYLKEFEENELWKKYTQPYYKFILDKYIGNIDLMFCVSRQISNEYLKHYKIKSVEITNATDFKNLSPKETTAGQIKIVHHGAAIRSREIERMIETKLILGENYSLHLILIDTDKEYLHELKTKYSENAFVFFDKPVAVLDIAEEINKYDIGIFILPPANFNWINALPNKLFEFIQGRLCIAVSPNPDMKNLVEKYNLGIVSNDFSPQSMAGKIKELSAESIMKYKTNAHNNAKELSAESNQHTILQTVNDLLKN